MLPIECEFDDKMEFPHGVRAAAFYEWRTAGRRLRDLCGAARSRDNLRRRHTPFGVLPVRACRRSEPERENNAHGKRAHLTPPLWGIVSRNSGFRKGLWRFNRPPMNPHPL